MRPRREKSDLRERQPDLTTSFSEPLVMRILEEVIQELQAEADREKEEEAPTSALRLVRCRTEPRPPRHAGLVFWEPLQLSASMGSAAVSCRLRLPSPDTKRHTFGVVYLEPLVSSITIGKYLEVVNVADLL